MVRARFALPVVLAVVVAGCGSFAGGGQSTATGPTVTPVPVPSDTGSTPGFTTVTASELPPGIRSNGTLDLEALRTAHRRLVQNRSATLTVTGTVPGETGLRSYRYRAATDGRSTFLTHLEIGNSSRTSYAVGDVRFVREFNGTTGQLDVSSRPATLTMTAEYHASLLTGYMHDEAHQIDTVRRNGTAYARVYFVGTPDAGARNVHENATRYRTTAYVRPDGLIRTVVVTYEYVVDGEQEEYSLRLQQHDIGSTSVAIPDWVGTGNRNATGTATATVKATQAPANGTSNGETHGTANGETNGTAATGSPTATASASSTATADAGQVRDSQT